MTAEEDWLVPIDGDPLDGTEKFAGMDKSVVNFWQFALGDLRMNNARGYLAEFIVATALGISTKRVEWAGFDLDWQGVTIEVKSSAHLTILETTNPLEDRVFRTSSEAGCTGWRLFRRTHLQRRRLRLLRAECNHSRRL